ncbi:ABC-type bacteriocin/lantibiotic exporter with double-glycine peptidase domain [Lysobacter niabensis]|uniref:ABC-type bacteriocin/lantibiotic exporter with double-glycine peptidase domain n=1 Tax=Agrilutibacter niabensis TaxID=380628 RepID=A0ABU1VM43_9GAMM|nr:ABC-type bacteriocin/lantibiotic exporter with double-glycine peptidase domain [Lysobacter niabensis]
MKERLVNDAVRQLGLTKVIVAHRPETIASADRILLIGQGRVVRDFRLQAHAAAVGGATEERHPAASSAL